MGGNLVLLFRQCVLYHFSAWCNLLLGLELMIKLIRFRGIVLRNQNPFFVCAYVVL